MKPIAQPPRQQSVPGAKIMYQGQVHHVHPQQYQQYHQNIRQQVPAPYPNNSRLTEILEALKSEFDSVSESVGVYKMQRDEYEIKREINAFQQTLYELERAHQKMKHAYEEEIVRLRRELEARGVSVPANDSFLKRNREEVPNAAYPQHPANKLPKIDPEPYRAPMPPQAQRPVQPPPNQQQIPPQHYPQAPQHQTPQQSYPVQSYQQTPAVAPALPPQPQSQPPPPLQPQPPTIQPPAPQQQTQQPPVQPQPSQSITGFCDLDPETAPPSWKKEGSDWIAVFNHKSPVLQQDHLNVDLVHNLDHDSVVCCVKFSLCGRYLATGCNRYAQIFEVQTGQKLTTLYDDSATENNDLYIRSVVFSPDARFLAAGAEDRGIRIWDIAKQRVRMLLTGHTQDIYSLDWTKDGKFVVSGSGDRSIKVWDAESGQCVLTMSNDDDLIPSSQSSNLNPSNPLSASVKDSGVTSVALNPVYSRCVAAGSLDRMVRIWDIRTGKLLERFEGHRDSVYSVAFSPDGRSIVSGSLDKTLKIWDLSSHTLNYLALYTSPDEQPGTPSFQTTVNTVCRHTFGGHKDFVLSVAFAGLNGSLGRVDDNGDPVATPGGDALAEVEWIVSGSKDRGVTFWDGGRGGRNSPDLSTACQFTLQGHKNSVISVALAPGGGLFATGSGDNRARIWRVYADRGVNPLPPAGPQHHSASVASSQTSMNPQVQHPAPPAAQPFQAPALAPFRPIPPVQNPPLQTPVRNPSAAQSPEFPPPEEKMQVLPPPPEQQQQAPSAPVEGEEHSAEDEEDDDRDPTYNEA